MVWLRVIQCDDRASLLVASGLFLIIRTGDHCETLLEWNQHSRHV